VCGDRELASDATQEAFLRAYHRWHRVKAYDNPAGWVRHIAINLTRAEHRSSQRRTRREQLTNQAPTHAPPIEPTGSVAIDTLMMLPDRQRAVAALFYLDDMSTAEIAVVLDIAEGTVRFHLSQARARLREALGSDPEVDHVE
jgi:RNA polymerase sigma-70 factor (ECF subfamily)